jgi:hypothetical protein
VLQQLREIKPGLTSANIPAAVQAANEMAGRGRNMRKLVVVISDDQKSNWAVGNDGAWRLTVAGLREKESPVLSLPVVGTSSAANVSVGNVTVQPAFLGVNRPAQVTATVSNTGAGELGTVTLQLIVDGRNVGAQQIGRLGPGQSNTVRFDHFFTEPGSHWLRVKAEVVDGLEADNVATAAVNVSPRLPVLIIDGQRTSGGPLGNFPAAAFLTAAMQPMDSGDASTLVAPKVVSVASMNTVRIEDYPIVVLNDVPRLPAEMVSRLADYVQRGNGLWIILGSRTEESFLNGTLGKSPLFPAQAGKVVATKADGTGSGPVEIDIKEPENAALALVTAAQKNALAGATVRAWWPVKAGGAMRTILATTTGDPLDLEMEVGKAGGRVVVWTTSVSDVGWNNLPLVPNFVPLVNETLFHLASGQAQTQQRQVDAGAAIVWTGPAAPVITSATLVAPDTSTKTLQPQLRGDKYVVQYKETFLPGLYEMRFTPPGIPQPVYFSVGIDPAELQPAVMTSSDVEWLKSHRYVKERVTLETLPKAIDAQRAGYELWWIVGLLLVLLLLGEVVMTWRLARKQTDVDVENAGLVKPTRDLATAAVGGSVR